MPRPDTFVPPIKIFAIKDLVVPVEGIYTARRRLFAARLRCSQGRRGGRLIPGIPGACFSLPPIPAHSLSGRTQIPPVTPVTHQAGHGAAQQPSARVAKFTSARRGVCAPAG